MIVGGGMAMDLHKPLRAMGQQFLAWGFIDLLIARFGARQARKKEARGDEVPKERRSIRRLLWLNTFLDVGYMAGGLHLMNKHDEVKQGHGRGILIQGAFLFVFDLIHALLVGRTNKE